MDVGLETPAFSSRARDVKSEAILTGTSQHHGLDEAHGEGATLGSDRTTSSR